MADERVFPRRMFGIVFTVCILRVLEVLYVIDMNRSLDKSIETMPSSVNPP